MPRGARVPDLPKRLINLLPRRRPPYDLFFENVLAYLQGPAKFLNFTNPPTMRRFDEELTAAVVKDLEKISLKMHSFSNSVEQVKTAFGTQRANAIIDFLDEYRTFAMDYTYYHENVPHGVFPEYVRKLIVHIDTFVEFRKRFAALRAPLIWPSPFAIKRIILPADVVKKFEKKGSAIEPLHPTDRKMGQTAIKNFELAMKLIKKLQKKITLPQFDLMISWLKEGNCFQALYQELETSRDAFATQMAEMTENFVGEVNIVKALIAQRNWDPDALQDVAERSVQAVEHTGEYCFRLAVEYLIVFHGKVASAYEMTFELLENFKSNLQTVPQRSRDEQTTREYQKASNACQNWIDALIFSRQKLEVDPFEFVLEQLPQISTYIAFFTFEYQSL